LKTKKKLRLTRNLAAADDFAEKAEHSNKLTLIAQSNDTRKAAKQKDVKLKSVDQQLGDKLAQLSNCQ